MPMIKYLTKGNCSSYEEEERGVWWDGAFATMDEDGDGRKELGQRMDGQDDMYVPIATPGVIGLLATTVSPKVAGGVGSR